MKQNYLIIEAKVRTLWQCAGCGTMADGDVITATATELAALEMYPAHPTHMPVGWVAFGRRRTCCPCCKSKGYEYGV